VKFIFLSIIRQQDVAFKPHDGEVIIDEKNFVEMRTATWPSYFENAPFLVMCIYEIW